MADFSSLKQTIQSYIKQNGNEEITGNILQDVLLAMVTTMGDGAINSLASALQDEITARQNQNGTLQGNITAETTARQQADTALGGRIDGLQTAINGINTKLAEGYIYAGIATPSTNPGTPSGKVFYIAVSSGTYTNFSNLTVAQGINILKYNGSSWSKDVVYAIDARPKKNSQNFVTSGGVFDNIGALDVSELNATENPHTLAQYADLSAALAAIPTDYQKGGMSVKFVHSSDNKYVQFRCMAQNFTTNVANWQGVDEEPTAGSDNLVKSGGITQKINSFTLHINETSTKEVYVLKGIFLKYSVIRLYLKNVVKTGTTGIPVFDQNNTLLRNFQTSRETVQEKVLMNDVTELHFKANMLSGSSLACDIMVEVVPPQSNVAPIDRFTIDDAPFNVKKIVKEVYLTGLDSNKNYGLTFYKGTTELHLNIVELPSYTVVAQGLCSNGIISISQVNSSGVSGYAVTNLNHYPDDWYNGVISDCQIDKAVVSDVRNSPVINSIFYNSAITNLRTPSLKYFTEPSPNSLIRKIEELHLTGLDDSTNYYLRVYTSDTYHELQVFTSLSTPAKTCIATATSFEGNGLYEIKQRNNSGITGYVLANSSDIPLTSITASINKDIVSDLTESLRIQSMISTQIRQYVVAPSGGDYTSFSKCVLEATKYPNSKVFVKDGTYDIEAEFKELYGNDFFDNFTSSSRRGVILKNGIDIECSPRSYIVFNYDGNNTDVMSIFSPLNSFEGDFRLKGANVIASMCRYCFHDECAQSTEPYTHIYDGCYMYLDNSGNTAWESKQCIGGGLGKCGTVYVQNNCFESIGIDSYTKSIVTWHNNVNANAKSTIHIINNYFKGIGTFALKWYGASTEITTAYVSGNSLGSELVHKAENSSATIENTRLREWNNIVRV